MAKRELKTKVTEETVVEESIVEEPIIEEPVEEVVEPKIIPIGIVSNCLKLNLRNKANAKADVIKVLDAKTEMVIDPDYKNDKWYKVTVSDLTGYCMKEFVVIK